MSSRPALAAPFFALSIVLAFLVPVVRATETTSYEQNITVARTFAAKGSWAKAREAYADALLLAPDADTRRWCELWLETIPTNVPNYWTLEDSALNQFHDHLEVQLKPYREGQARDELWVSILLRRVFILRIMEIRKDTKSRTYWDHDMYDEYPKSSREEVTEVWPSWDDLLSVADYRASRTTAPDGIHDYVEVLQKGVALLGIANRSQAASRLRTHLATAAKLAASPDDHAWCQLALARSNSDDARLSYAERDRLWSAALSAAQGTIWQPTAEAAELIWLVRRQDGPTPPENAPRDRYAALQELKSLRQTAGSLGKTLFPGDPHTVDGFIASLETSSLIVEGPELLGSGEPASFAYAATNYGSLHATLFRIPWEAQERYASPVRRKDRVVVKEWEIPLPDNRSGIWNHALIEMGTTLLPGNYELHVVGMHGPGTWDKPQPDWSHQSRRSFSISDISAAVFSTTTGRSTVFLKHRSSRLPVADTDVQTVCLRASAPDDEHFELKTDADGCIFIPAPIDKPGAASPETETVLMSIGTEQLLISRNRTLPPLALSFETIVENADVHPGETAQVQILALNYIEGDLISPALPLMIEATLNGAVLVGNQPLLFSENCLASVKIPIPQGSQPGTVRLTIHSEPNTTAEPLQFACNAFDIKVANPSPIPVSAKIELLSGTESLHPDGEIVLRVKLARQSDSRPFAHALIHCVVVYNDEDIFQPLSGNVGPVGQQGTPYTERTLSATTQADGTAEFRFRNPSGAKQTTSLFVRIAPAPVGVETAPTFSIISGAGWNAPISVHGPAYFTNTANEDISLQDASALAVAAVRMMGGNGSPVPFKGEAHLVERKWTEHWVDSAGADIPEAVYSEFPDRFGQSRSDLERQGWQLKTAGYTETVIATRKVKGGRDGLVTTSFPLPHAGIYQVQFWDRESCIPNFKIGRYDNDFLDRLRGVTFLAVASATRSLALDPRFQGVFPARSINGAGSDLTTLVLPEGENPEFVYLAGRSDVCVQRIPPDERIVQVKFKSTPVASGFGQVGPIGSPVIPAVFVAPEPKLPPVIARVNRQLQQLTNHYRRSFFIPSDDPFGLGLEPYRDEGYTAANTLGGRRLWMALPLENSKPTSLDLSAFLAQVGLRGPVQFGTEEIHIRSAQPSAIRPDARIYPVPFGEELGYAPEEIRYITLSPF